MEEAVKIFEKQRSELLRLAYSMTGRVSVAEDIVQDAWLRWKNVDISDINSPEAYLSTIVSRLCLDYLKSARNRRESYVGPDLPEPVVESTPDHTVELSDALSMAMLVVLEKLTPIQRAVFILREVFNYNYAEIAEIVDRTASHCRKIAQRARDNIGQSDSRFETDQKKQQELLEAFMKAVEKGDLDQLESMLAEDATLYSDGGGKVTAARKPVLGAQKIARFMVGISGNAPDNIQIEFTAVNNQTGLLVYFGEQLQSVWSFMIDEDSIHEIYVVLNPEKLDHLNG